MSEIAAGQRNDKLTARSLDDRNKPLIQKPQYIYKHPDEVPLVSDATQMPLYSGLVMSAIADIEGRHAVILDQLPRNSQGEPEAESLARLLEISIGLEYGGRVINGALTKRLYGEGINVDIAKTRELAKHHDHGWPHVRRTEAIIRLLCLSYQELSPEDWKLFVAVSAFPSFHDIGQIMSIVWNKENQDSPIKIKDAHAEEGAVIVDMLWEEVAREGNMTEALAKEICGLASIMIMVHDQPLFVEQRLRGTYKAFVEREDGTIYPIPREDLINHYAAGDLDLFTTSPSQRMDILRHLKEQKGIMKKGERQHGLHPLFEKAYQEQLEAVARDTEPTNRNISSKDRDSVVKMASIAVMADVLDMISPEATYLRKFNVNLSLQRSIFKSDAGMMSRIRDLDGEKANESDFERAAWECFAFVRLIKQTPLYKNEYVKTLVANTVIKGLFDDWKITRKLMEGEQGFGVIDEMKTKRVWEVGLKALRRAERISLETQRQIQNRSMVIEDAEELTDYFIRTFDRLMEESVSESDRKILERYKRRFIHRSQAIDTELEVAKQRLREKTDASDGHPKVYLPEDFDALDDAYDEIFRLLCEELEITIEYGSEVEGKLTRKEPVKTVNNGGYDSVSGPNQMRTMIEVPQEILEYLETVELGNP